VSARTPKGKRAQGFLPRKRRENVTVLASFSLSGRGEAMSSEGSAHARICERDVEHFLVSSLKEGQIVVMDTLHSHKGRNVRELSEACGCQVLFFARVLARFFPD
jgi:hypothetical protein